MTQLNLIKILKPTKADAHAQAPRVIPFAVVGIVDIVSSSQIANVVGPVTEWQMKNTFFSAAQKRALECGISIVNFTGDGFSFLLDETSSKEDLQGIIDFHVSLNADFQEILASLGDRIGAIQSGLRMGVSAGTVVLGHLAAAQMTIVGAEVNLAARLCSGAGINEMVLSTRVWDLMRLSFQDLEVEKRTLSNLKGFSSDVLAVSVPAPASLAGFASFLNRQSVEVSQNEMMARIEREQDAIDRMLAA